MCELHAVRFNQLNFNAQNNFHFQNFTLTSFNKREYRHWITIILVIDIVKQYVYF